MMAKKRILWIDYIKGICMMVIILNHIPGLPLLARLTYPFELLGFFFVGGYTFSIKYDFGDYLRNKAQRLVFPVFAFGFVNLILALPVKNVNFVERIKGVVFQLPGQYDDMWFVACLFTMELLLYPLLRLIKSTWMRISFVLLGTIFAIVWFVTTDIQLPWHVLNALFFLPIVLLGYLANKWGIVEAWRNNIQVHGEWKLVPVMLYLASVFAFDNWPIDIHLLQYGNILAFVVSSIFGLWMVISITIWLERFDTSKLANAIKFVGKNSLAYYGMQSKVISLLIFTVSMTNATIPMVISKLGIWIVALIVLAGLTYMINRWFPFMVGSFNSNQK